MNRFPEIILIAAILAIGAMCAETAGASILIPGTNINWTPGPNTIPGFQPTVNVDGLANYSFAAPFANIVQSFDEGTLDSYLTGYIDGDYVVTWTGSGTPTITGGKSSWQITGPNSAIFHLHHDSPGPNGGGYFTLNASGANLSTLQVIAPDRYQNTSFRTPFVNLYQSMNAKDLRFMDVEQTVGNLSTVNYSTRNTGFTNISAKGWRYEDMIEMAAVLKVPEIWINVPANVNPTASTDNWIDGIANLIKTKLPSTTKVHIEYSNEGWNTASPNYAPILTAARANPNIPGPSDYERTNQQNAYMLKLSVDRLRATLGHDRVIPEISALVANQYTGIYQFEELKRLGVADPGADGYRLAVSYYVPGSPTDAPVTGSDSHATAFAKLDAFKNNSVKGWLQQMKSVADLYHSKMDAYESDFASSYTNGDASLTALYTALQSDPQLTSEEVAFIKDFKAISPDGDLTQFGMVSPYSQFGQWGVTQDVNDWLNSPKLNAWWQAIDYSNVAAVPEPSILLLAPLTFLARRTSRKFRMVGRRAA